MSTESYGDEHRMLRRALVATALAFSICHHLGLLPSGLGSGPHGTQWADWLDLLVPWLVLVPAAVALSAARLGPRLWFAGVALVVAALAVAMSDRPRTGLIGHGLAVAAGLTWATNAIGGGTVVFSLVVALAAVGFGWRHRTSLAGVLWVGFAPAVVVLVGELLVR